jgi:GDP-mannose 6-dehydrogenase
VSEIATSPLKRKRAVRISIFGLGYVGTVSAGCLAQDGHKVVGADPVRTKVDLINDGQSPIIETAIGEIIATTVRSGALRATDDVTETIRTTELSFVCVGTPSLSNGNLDLGYVRRVCEQIGQAIAKKADRHLVVIRSTILPGTMHTLVIPTLEESSGKKAGVDFGVCHNPEFLREGSAVEDFYHPPKTVIGELDAASGDALVQLYDKIDAPLILATELGAPAVIDYLPAGVVCRLRAPVVPAEQGSSAGVGFPGQELRGR